MAYFVAVLLECKVSGKFLPYTNPYIEESLLSATFAIFKYSFFQKSSVMCAVLGISFIVFLTGCGSGGPSVTAVTGVVTLDGKPLGDAVVTFSPTDESGVGAAGKTQADGTFVLNATGAAPGSGTAVGSYAVTVDKVILPEIPVISEDDPRYGTEEEEKLVEKAMKAEPEYVVPKAYGHRKTSGLTATVSSGENNFTFALESSFGEK